MIKYDSRLVRAMRSYFTELEKSSCCSMNGYFPVKHEKKIRSILNNAQRMLRPNLKLNDMPTICENTWHSCVGFARERIVDKMDKTSDLGIAWAADRIETLEAEVREKDKKIAELRVKSEAADTLAKEIGKIGSQMIERGL